MPLASEREDMQPRRTCLLESRKSCLQAYKKKLHLELPELYGKKLTVLLLDCYGLGEKDYDIFILQ